MNAIVPQMSVAQSPAACQPPQRNEYLLLVITPTSDNQEVMRRTLPRDVNLVVCNYQGSIVTRVNGFRTLEDANRWGKYIQEIVGLSPVIAQTSSIQQAANPAPPSPEPRQPNTTTYNPQPLGKGYAILIDYFHQPEIASQIKEVLGQDVGLVSYLARPYLLGLYTENQQEANDILQRLSDRGFWVLIVDSRRVMLLTPIVRY